MTAILSSVGRLADTHPRFVETMATALVLFAVSFTACAMAWIHLVGRK